MGAHLILILIVIGIPVILILFLVKVFSTNNIQKKDTSITSIAGELEKLHALKEKGVITQEEFESKKSKLL